MSTACELERSVLFLGAPGLSSIYCERFSRCCYERRASIFAQGDEARFVHIVIKGVVRLTRLLDDGREGGQKGSVARNARGNRNVH
jgi:hypothetical protein